MIFKIAGYSDVGNVRKINEDSFATGDSFALVADGMGGHKKGEVASKITVDTISEALNKCAGDDYESLFIQAIKKANKKVFDLANKNDSMNGMGTTFVGCVWKNNNFFAANVGDSRCYLFSKNKLVQITKDHSFVQKLIDEGKITKDEANTRLDKNLILRAVGCEKELEIDTFNFEVFENDVVMLCSDGLTNMVSEDNITKIISDKNIEKAGKKLIETAKKNGGKDNITVVLIKCLVEEESK